MKGTWDDDRDPLAALRRGEPGLFEAFVQRETGTLLGFFRHLGASHHESEDMTQEVLLKLYRSAATYEPRSTFTAYALRVARNAWIDRRRRRGARPAAGALSIDEERGRAEPADVGRREVDPARPLQEREEAERLERALARLSPLHAETFELAVVQGLPYAQVAEVLDVPVGTVKSRVFHAVRKLRAELEESPAPEEPRR